MRAAKRRFLWLALLVLAGGWGGSPTAVWSQTASLSDERLELGENAAETNEFTSAAAVCDCPECRAAAEAARKKQESLKKAVAGAYKPVFYDNDFRYLLDPDYDGHFFGDRFKQVEFGDCWMVDLGGQYRARFQSENNFRGLGLTGRDDAFLLHRTRLFANARYGDRWRIYAEYSDAESNYENLPSRSIEVDRSDLLNLFVDWKCVETDHGDLLLRVGRQELLYGNQRLISPLDWANMRRTFEGVKLAWSGSDWNIDGFYTHPVLVRPHEFDSPDYREEFMGTYATYKAIQDQTIDLYYLRFNNDQGFNNFRYNTVGSRWTATYGEWLLETEGGVQFGENTGGSDHGAGFAMGGVGHSWKEHAWKPILWANFDYASGGNLRGAGRGFNHLFPLAHKYLGFMDLYGRSNISSPNVQLTLRPHEKLQILLWYYYFFLSSQTDTPYNVNMTPFAPGVTPGSRDLGSELDLVCTYSVTPRMEVLFGYSHFWSGQYYQTPGLPYSGDANFYYVHWLWNF